MNLNERLAYLKKLAPEQCYRAEYEQNAYIEIRYLAQKDLFEVRIERPDYMDKPQTEVREYTEEEFILVFAEKIK